MTSKSLSLLSPVPGVVELADWVRATKRSNLQELLSQVSRPDIISFALGLPAVEFFPADQIADSAAAVLKDDPRALQYGPPYQPLKEQIVCSLMKLRGVRCDEDEIFLTTGAQQGMNLLARLLLNHRGQVLVEEAIYSGLRQVLEPFQPRILTVRTCPHSGMDVDGVEYLLRKGARPSFIYAIPDGHNPTGASMSMEKRLRLVDLACRHAVPIVEDDAYGFLCYERAVLPPLRALDPKWIWYVGTFSKILAPGLRVGWTVVPREVTPALSITKEASDIDSSTFTQRVISRYLDSNPIPDRIRVLTDSYRTRRDTMLSALENYFPAWARWALPPSGFFVWVELAVGMDTGRLLTLVSKSQQVLYVPGQTFSATGDRTGSNCLRLNFSNCTPPMIEEGIKRLARVLQISRPS